MTEAEQRMAIFGLYLHPTQTTGTRTSGGTSVLNPWFDGTPPPADGVGTYHDTWQMTWQVLEDDSWTIIEGDREYSTYLRPEPVGNNRIGEGDRSYWQLRFNLMIDTPTPLPWDPPQIISDREGSIYSITPESSSVTPDAHDGDNYFFIGNWLPWHGRLYTIESSDLIDRGPT